MKRILIALLSLLSAFVVTAGLAEEANTGKRVVYRNTENNSIELSYVDEAGSILNSPYGYATIEFLYENGAKYHTKIRYLDKDGNRVMNESGYSVAKYTYKEDGTIRQVEFYNAEGKEQALPEGYSRIQIRYKDGEPTL